MTSLRIPSPLQPYVEGNREVDVTGSTVAEAIQNLTERYPHVKNHLCSEDGALRPYIHIYRNDTNVRELEGMKTAIGTHDRLLILPSIAGGSHQVP
jgi:molybdopterin converting factor small subunit